MEGGYNPSPYGGAGGGYNSSPYGGAAGGYNTSWSASSTVPAYPTGSFDGPPGGPRAPEPNVSPEQQRSAPRVLISRANTHKEIGT